MSTSKCATNRHKRTLTYTTNTHILWSSRKDTHSNGLAPPACEPAHHSPLCSQLATCNSQSIHSQIEREREREREAGTGSAIVCVGGSHSVPYDRALYEQKSQLTALGGARGASAARSR